MPAFRGRRVDRRVWLWGSIFAALSTNDVVHNLRSSQRHPAPAPIGSVCTLVVAYSATTGELLDSFDRCSVPGGDARPGTG